MINYFIKNTISWKILILLGVLVISSCHSSKSTTKSKEGSDILKSPDYIVWGKREITWDDYKGIRKSKKYYAGTYAGISFTTDKDGKLLTFAFFSKNDSWQNHRSDEGLVHEKYHFNIVEIFARKIRKDLNEKIVSSKPISQFNDYVVKVWKEVEKMQSDYDEETNHSRNKKSQINWQLKIDTELDKLSQYKDSRVSVPPTVLNNNKNVYPQQ